MSSAEVCIRHTPSRPVREASTEPPAGVYFVAGSYLIFAGRLARRGSHTIARGDDVATGSLPLPIVPNEQLTQRANRQTLATTQPVLLLTWITNSRTECPSFRLFKIDGIQVERADLWEDPRLRVPYNARCQGPLDSRTLAVNVLPAMLPQKDGGWWGSI
ncbi:hypothetical protein FA13DRAFT_773755 [Coprinellus micaceus]|uniref:Uncharacterized protein n=1 Tax=Coprinellus micaceus TaxID=71717 RepID=A0A4Y7T394_COPMI|nr:hypothetical protein FA13DRAFT_773755 [Coprinellus micaceus]